jgi:sulfite reductase (NADPH) flavoprotein alpha-component
MNAGFGPHNPVLARVVENRRLTAAGHFQDVRHLSFDLEQTGLQHDPGDALALVPRQPDAAVHAFLQCVGLLPDARLRVALAHSAPDDVETPAFQVQSAALQAINMSCSSCCWCRCIISLVIC